MDHIAIGLVWGAVIAFGLVLPVVGAREGIRWALRRALLAVAIYAAVTGGLVEAAHVETTAAAVFGVVAALVIAARTPKRSRHIPARIRRAVIARDLKGAKFDRSKHAIDHIMPFARGGSHTMDNLRVIERRANLRKGKKFPKPHDWF